MSGMEIERKFLVKDTSYRQLSRCHHHIRQAYICSGHGHTVRVRTRDDEAFLTIKGPSRDGGLSRYEFEHVISGDEARGLMAMAEPGVIDKTRYLVDAGDGHTFEVDEFHGDNEGLVIAEVELHAPDEPYVCPPFIAREVTGDKRYYNSHLRSFPYCQWPERTNQDTQKP